ncbi:MAG: tRNA uracil 4-sulfurtransferase ThiI, partial [bacterium]
LPYTHFDLALMTQEVPYDLILFRRFMARLAEAVATQVHADVLVTGDNLGQVASQTMQNMISMNKSIEMPIFRPLLTYDKEEIIQQSYNYDLFEICKEPYKDCCALISRKPRTQSQHDKLTGLEERCFPNYAEIIHNTLSEVQQLDFEYGKLVEVRKVKLL